jgi:hypothetical protein
MGPLASVPLWGVLMGHCVGEIAVVVVVVARDLSF